MKAACYCATRNVYDDVIPALKSLLKHSDVEKVYLLLEDDEFPEKLPECCEVINVSGQEIFRPDGPNFVQHWTWMALMRAALTKVLPQELDRVLSLDLDTIVLDDISELWDEDLDGWYIAGVPEPLKCRGDMVYINNGVVLQNLKLLRETHMDDEIIRKLNRKFYFAPEQDAINVCCWGMVKALDGRYNVTPEDFTKRSDHSPKIIHYAAVKADWRKYALVERYRKLPWCKVRAGL